MTADEKAKLDDLCARKERAAGLPPGSVSAGAIIRGLIDEAYGAKNAKKARKG